MERNPFRNTPWSRYDAKRKYRRLVIHTFDNASHLPADYIPSLFAKFGDNANLVRAHLYGEFCHLTGKAAVPDFREARDVVTFEPDPFSPIIFSSDYNVDPLAWVAMQERWIEQGIDRRREIGVVAESKGTASLVVDSVVEFIMRFKDPRFRNTPIHIDGDSQGHRRNPLGRGTPFTVTKETLVDFGFKNVQIVGNKFNPPEEDSLEELNRAFSNQWLKVDKTCANTIRSLLSSQLITGQRKLKKEAGDMVTHWLDAVKYPIFRLTQSHKIQSETKLGVLY